MDEVFDYNPPYYKILAIDWSHMKERILSADGCKNWFLEPNFYTLEEAVKYHDLMFPEMRSINAHGNYISDWSPKTFLKYTIRKMVYDNQLRCYVPFPLEFSPV